jgi:hypothetical protein
LIEQLESQFDFFEDESFNPSKSQSILDFSNVLEDVLMSDFTSRKQTPRRERDSRKSMPARIVD